MTDYNFYRMKIPATTGTIYSSVGSGTITSGNNSVTITHPFVTANSKIFLTIGVTANTLTSAALKIDTITAATSFVVMTADEVVTIADVPFNYLIIN